ncbi:XK-related protein 5 [Habropoda laboriosa]|uniref:XK-related protein n=1 Tax=Habropoda laboriosa TaxID=597456 RepID=A0A0L7QV89_9HYME|nr:XK-related protein 5 [Habropoda laboriosa]
MIKRASSKVYVKLYYIFQAALRLSYFPLAWKIAKVVPLPKPGKNHKLISSYRPISLLPSIAKIFEKIIYSLLNAHITKNNIIIDSQFDSIVFMEYFLQGQFIWGCFALSSTILPASVIQMFSLRWYHSDGSIKNIHWLLHFLFLGVLHRYLILLYATIYSLRKKRFVKDKNWVYRQESDICMLHLFESFMGAAPQLILQLYVMAVLRRTPLWTSLSAIVSFCSLSWAVGTYTKAMHKINPGYNETTWVVLTLQGLWRAGMLISRIAVLVLTAICLREWSLLFLGLHWLLMTIWVILQNTDFCPTIWEERIYNCIIGFIYCFDFFNLRVGKSRYRVLIFYSIIVIENIVFLVVYVLCFKDVIKAEEITIMTSLIIGGMMIGLMSMLFYYGKFHPSKVGSSMSIKSEKRPNIVANKAVTPRSFKQYYPNSFALSSCSVDHSQGANSEEITTDKQFLLTNIVQNSECTENGVTNQSYKTENEPQTAICVVSESSESARKNFSKDETMSSNFLSKTTFPMADNTCEYLEVQSDCNDSSEKDIHCQKRRGICLPITHGLDIDKDVQLTKESSNSCLPLQKRREGGLIVNICDELNGITMLRDRLKTPIFNDTCEKIPDTEKLTKELQQQRDETMSCVTSIHDYENVCPLGVARPPWCIRSWKGYTDIETYIHDDSVVRDRRRDTLTSTTTGTTYSSEFSDTTCASSILRGIFKQDDYIDTLTYDLIDSRELKMTYNEYPSSTKRISDIDEQNSTLYIAKPVVIDDKGGMFALDTILEEHDEIFGEEKFKYNRSGCGSVSTLVSTIDQIRKYTAENSPRHVYHTTGSQWEDFHPKSFIKKAQLTKTLFNDAATYNRNYINCLDESDSIKDLVKYCTIESIKKKKTSTPLIDGILFDSPILCNKTKLQKQVSVAYWKDDESISNSKENDLYVEMSPLVPVTENKFESKSQLVYVVTPTNAIQIQQSSVSPELDTTKKNVSVILKKSSDCTKHDKENLAPIAPFKVNHANHALNVDRAHSNRESTDFISYENDESLCNSDLNLKERRHIFLEQGLSPPKLLTWNKRKSFGGCTIKKL